MYTFFSLQPPLFSLWSSSRLPSFLSLSSLSELPSQPFPFLFPLQSVLSAWPFLPSPPSQPSHLPLFPLFPLSVSLFRPPLFSLWSSSRLPSFLCLFCSSFCRSVVLSFFCLSFVLSFF